jgi:aminoglycoside 3-N-acetyltransferase
MKHSPISKDSVVEQLRALGVEEGSVLLVHTSFSLTGPVEGGPDGLIDALVEAIGPEGTLVMPSWTDDDDEVFDPASYEVDEHLGVVADEFWQRPGVVRGTHPFAVAALGPLAAEIAGAPFVLPPHAPDSGVARVHDNDGWVLLLGVDHDADTSVHLAELIADVPYRVPHHITVLEEGEPKRIDYGENDHCCQNFIFVGDWLRARGLQREGIVGYGRAQLVRSRDVVSTVVQELEADPCRFLHRRGTCDSCDEAWESVQLVR